MSIREGRALRIALLRSNTVVVWLLLVAVALAALHIVSEASGLGVLQS